MRIVLYAPAVTRIRGGIERLAAQLTWHLTKAGHQVVLQTHNRNDPTAVVPVYELPAEAVVQPMNFVHDSDFEAALQAGVLALEPDVVCVLDGPRTFGLYARALDGTGVPLVYSEHLSPSVAVREAGGVQERHALLRSADGVHVLERAFLRSLPYDTDRVQVAISNPIDPGVDALPAQRSPVVLCVARVHFAQKAQDVLLKAFEQVAAEVPGWTLRFVGQPHHAKEERAFRAMIAASPAASSVEWVPGVPHEDVVRLMDDAAVFALPSWFEGSPISLAEAMSRGMACVGFEECEGVAAQVTTGRNGLLAPGGGDPDSLARALRVLLRSPALRRNLSEGALTTARRRAEVDGLAEWESFIEAVVATAGTGKGRST